jgi:NADP-dependent 3-hydroxy acid dehydrogenase YdfG
MAVDLRGTRVMVTGVTSGIGEATAEALCAAGVKELVAIARREDRLKKLGAAWNDRHGTDVAAIVLDVRDRAQVDDLAKQHPNLFDVQVLVNNAGLARGRDPVQDADPTDFDEMVDTNIKGLLYMTRHVVPNMVKAGRGHVVNLGSVAGRWTYPGGAVYSATKAAVGKITEGLRMDLLGKNVRVTNVEPGLVETEFSLVRFKGDAAAAKKVYADTRALRPADVAETIVWCLTRPDHVNVQELVLSPTDQAHVGMVHRAPN